MVSQKTINAYIQYINSDTIFIKGSILILILI